MGSIIISFVGNQDPYSGTTDRLGSIVSLTKHLLTEKQSIKHIHLLYTSGTKQGAKDTKEWLNSELHIPLAAIETYPVDEALSDDPIDVALTTRTAKQALEKVNAIKDPNDIIEFNASSGTPAMKSTWSILQAAGYAPNCHVWQVRNPKELKDGQQHVFTSDVSSLKQEFDLNIIKQQLAEYNYSGALAMARSANLANSEIDALLKYGHSRRSFDFDRAHDAINNCQHILPTERSIEIAQLRQKDKLALLKEVYFIAEISCKNQDYCNFLIAVAQFQENFLKFCLENFGLPISDRADRMYEFWEALKKVKEGAVYRELEIAKSSDRRKVHLALSGNLNIPTQIEILELLGLDVKLLDKIRELKDYCTDRNAYIHRLEGISQIDDAESVLRNVRSILKKYTKMPDLLPFDLLNNTILDLLLTKYHPPIS